MERAPSKRPTPWNTVTPYVLSSVATPPVICFTTAFFHSTACAKSSVGSFRTPSLGLISRAAWSACAVCTQAFVGMHPTRRQVPPSSSSCSMQATLAPS
jgi:hypothetical protein